MTANISLPTRNVDYAGWRPVPDRLRITDFNLQANYYKRFYMTMSHAEANRGLYQAFERAMKMQGNQ